MILSLRRRISKVIGTILLVCSFGLVQINWTGCSLEDADGVDKTSISRNIDDDPSD